MHIIAVGGIAHETNTFSTLPTTESDFSVRREDSVLPGGCTLIPLLHASAPPSGPVTRSCFRGLLDELVGGLKDAMPVDGVLLHLHGAMEVDGIGDGETEILRSVRHIVGPSTLVAVTLDLHANLAPAVVEMSNIITAYRTAPHRDSAETRARGAQILIRCLEEGLAPCVKMVKLPLLVSGEAAVTEAPPADELYAGLDQLVVDRGLLDASILIGCAWTDSPHTGVAALACGINPEATEAAAGDLATKIWDRHEEFAIDSPTASIDEAIEMASETDLRPVFVSDSGDNPTAGAAGDSPMFLQHLIATGTKRALVAGIADEAAAAACLAAGTTGSVVHLDLGGKIDDVNASPIEVEGTLLRTYREDEVFGDVALVHTAGVDVVIQSSRRPFTTLDAFDRLGMDPQSYDLIVVKLGYLFPELRDYAPHHIMALSPGFTDLRLAQLPYRRVTRPIYPLDSMTTGP